ncbi:MAG: cyanase, partial [Roseicyclus sp.]
RRQRLTPDPGEETLMAATSPFVEPMMGKDDLALMILHKKKQCGMSWEAIAEAIGMSPVFVHSAAMGMNSMPADKAEALARLMALPQEAAAVLAEPPTKVWEQAVPTDPCVYRLYEIVGVYGPTIKALIQEKFGDGIMSAIDFDMFITRVEHPKGDRVKVEMTGKFLGYNSW